MKTIREGIDDIDRWIAENPDAPVKLPLPSSMERKIYLYSLEHLSTSWTKGDIETTRSMVICS
jgi:hypothetical protein